MQDWWELCWWAGGALSALALVVVVVAMLRDRSRGRRRCPGCWYDMSAVSGMMCPECGKTQKKEKRFFRTRRRWRGVASGVFLAIGACGIAVAPAAYTGKWTRFTPTPVLRFVLGHFKTDMNKVRQGTTNTGVAATLSVWERALLARSLAEPMKSELANPTSLGGLKSLTVSGLTSITFPERTMLHEMLEMAGELGEESRILMPELLACVDSNEFRRPALDALEKLGNAGDVNMGVITGMLLSAGSVEKKRHVVASVVRIDARDERTLRVLRTVAMSGADPALRLDCAASMMMLDAKEEGLVEVIGSIMEDAGPDERISAVRALSLLARIESDAIRVGYRCEWAIEMLLREGKPLASTSKQPAPGAFEGLIEALADPAGEVRGAVVMEFALAGERLLPYAARLKEAIERETISTTRRQITGFYLRLGVKDRAFLVPLYVDGLTSSDPVTRSWSVFVLGKCGEHAAGVVPEIEKYGVSRGGAEGASACQALSEIGPSGWDVLESWVRTSDERRLPAAVWLGEAARGDERATQSLLKLAGDDDQRVRAGAARGLATPANGVARLIEMARNDSAPEVRVAAIEAARWVSSDSAKVMMCTDALNLDEDGAVRRAAAETLRGLAPVSKAALAALRTTAAGSDPEASVVAKEMLILLEDR